MANLDSEWEYYAGILRAYKTIRVNSIRKLTLDANKIE